MNMLAVVTTRQLWYYLERMACHGIKGRMLLLNVKASTVNRNFSWWGQSSPWRGANQFLQYFSFPPMPPLPPGYGSGHSSKRSSSCISSNTIQRLVRFHSISFGCNRAENVNEFETNVVHWIVFDAFSSILWIFWNYLIHCVTTRTTMILIYDNSLISPQ